MFRQHARCSQRYPIRQPADMIDEGSDLLVDRCELLVRADGVLALSPQRVHRVQFRCARRQLQQPDAETMRFFLCGGCLQ